MPIEFLDLLATGDDDWEPLTPDRSAVNLWCDGGPLAEAPIDVGATFGGVAWRSTSIDPDFGLTGVRLGPGAMVPRHRHNNDLLVLVFGGSLVVRCWELDVEAEGATARADEAESEWRVRSGCFARIDAGTEFTLVASGDGATFLVSRPQDAMPLETVWSPDPAWVRRSSD